MIDDPCETTETTIMGPVTAIAAMTSPRMSEGRRSMKCFATCRSLVITRNAGPSSSVNVASDNLGLCCGELCECVLPVEPLLTGLDLQLLGARRLLPFKQDVNFCKVGSTKPDDFHRRQFENYPHPILTCGFFFALRQIRHSRRSLLVVVIAHLKAKEVRRGFR